MQPQTLRLGYSPCPNDTFIFHALTYGIVGSPGLVVHEQLEDVETLNSMAFRAELELTKVSFHAFAHLREEYCLLRSGAALGRGCGPLVVAREPVDMAALKGRTIAIPGIYTTAYLLLRLYGDGYHNVIPMRFDQIMPAVADGLVDAGLIIHEGRFTFPIYGLRQVIDLGQWWEAETGLPIPLGCIIARRTLGEATVDTVETLIRDSILHARAHPEASLPYIKAHAREMEDTVIARHIALYVNDFSLNITDEGVLAVRELFARGEACGVIPRLNLPLFI